MLLDRLIFHSLWKTNYSNKLTCLPALVTATSAITGHPTVGESNRRTALPPVKGRAILWFKRDSNSGP